MANLSDSPIFKKHDDYYTPASAWEQINHLIPPESAVWECCMLNSHLSKSPEYLDRLSNVKSVVYDKSMDMLKDSMDCSIIITNIPFSTEIKKKVLRRLIELDKPFIIIMNGMNIFTKYIREIFEGKLKDLQVINPTRKIQYDKCEGDTLTPTKNCSFYSVYLAYKLNLTQEQLWLC